MYNGIGIQSTRGTGTSGHVQRNIAALHRSHRRRTSNTNPNKKLRNALLKTSGGAHRAHEALRRVEVAVAELEEELAARGYDQDTIADMAQRLRKDLMSRDENEGKGERDREIEKGRGGTELMEHRNEKLRNVLGVQDDFAEGAVFRNMRSREEKGDAKEKTIEDEARDKPADAPADAADDGEPEKVALVRDTAKPSDPLDDEKVTSKADPALSDTDSSSLSESSDESDSDGIFDVPDVTEPVGKGIRPVVRSDSESAAEKPSPKRIEADGEAKLEEPREPVPVPLAQDKSKRRSQVPRSPHRFPSLSPSPRSGYERRGRTRSPSPRSEDRRTESPSRRDLSPPRRRRLSPRLREDLPRSRDISPRSRDISPVRRAPYPYDRYGTPKFRNGSSFGRSPSPRRTTNRRSPYDKNPTPHAAHEYQATSYDHRRSRNARPTYRRRSRSRSPSPERYRRYRDESPDSTSTSSRSPSPYKRRSSPRDRSPSPRRDISPYGRDLSRRRSPEPYSRKRRYSGYTPPRRVRHRRRSPYGYRRRRRSERRDRDRRYSSSDSDSSRSPPRYGTPPRRSRFSDYPTSRSLTPSPRYTRR